MSEVELSDTQLIMAAHGILKQLYWKAFILFYSRLIASGGLRIPLAAIFQLQQFTVGHV